MGRAGELWKWSRQEDPHLGGGVPILLQPARWLISYRVPKQPHASLDSTLLCLLSFLWAERHPQRICASPFFWFHAFLTLMTPHILEKDGSVWPRSNHTLCLASFSGHLRTHHYCIAKSGARARARWARARWSRARWARARQTGSESRVRFHSLVLCACLAMLMHLTKPLQSYFRPLMLGETISQPAVGLTMLVRALTL